MPSDELESRITKLEVNQENLKEEIKKVFDDYHNRIWNLVTVLFRIIIGLIAIIVTFAGIKLTGLIELLSKM